VLRAWKGVPNVEDEDEEDEDEDDEDVDVDVEEDEDWTESAGKLVAAPPCNTLLYDFSILTRMIFWFL